MKYALPTVTSSRLPPRLIRLSKGRGDRFCLLPVHAVEAHRLKLGGLGERAVPVVHRPPGDPGQKTGSVVGPVYPAGTYLGKSPQRILKKSLLARFAAATA